MVRQSPAWPALAVAMTTAGLEMSLATSIPHVGWPSQAPLSEKLLRLGVKGLLGTWTDGQTEKQAESEAGTVSWTKRNKAYLGTQRM